jgi:PAS domain S-box-containing protein
MPAAPSNTTDLNLNLALAVVMTSHAPVLLLDEQRIVIAASEAFCQAFGIDSTAVAGQAFAALGDGEWAIPQLQSLLKATASGFAEVKNYEFELKRAGGSPRCLILNAHKLNYGEGKDIRLLLAISDVTESRIAERVYDDLRRDRGILLQELQHRVANSLQIIASVLMQSARNVQSDEVKSHLHDAHNRVMSVAAVQKQLAISSADEVDLRPYLSQLCESIGASMIHDHEQIRLIVESDDSRVAANVSVSLGLVVTELVINALKHAFPEGRHGQIVVGYDSAGLDWTLSVADDGVGMPAQTGEAKAGLGTNIVQALARQLDARLTVADAAPGTIVSLEHEQATAGAVVTAV